jgi:hypothetical protein
VTFAFPLLHNDGENMEKLLYIICPKCGSYAVVTTRKDGFAYAYHYEVEKGVISRTCYLGKMIKKEIHSISSSPAYDSSIEIPSSRLALSRNRN